MLKKLKQNTEEEAFPANKPRYSYWSGKKIGYFNHLNLTLVIIF